jgi:hypothetical protein
VTGRKIVQVQKEIQIQLVPHSLAGRVFTVALAVLSVVLVFFFFAAGIALIGLLVAIGVGRLLWLSMKRQSR